MTSIRYALATLLALVCSGTTRAAPPQEKPMQTCCPVVELRQYTTYPGTRDTLIDLFEREFIESQEAVGIRLIAQFRDLNDPNRYVWFRGFPNMDSRKQSLTDFYTGDLWKAHREAANATLFDSDNVLLLRPARADAGFALANAKRAAYGDKPRTTDFVAVTIYYFKNPVGDDFKQFFADALRPTFEHSGADVLAELVSDHSENTFPRLPVREGENAFVWVARFDDRAAYDRYLVGLGADKRWSGELFAALNKQLARPPELLMLQAAARSSLGHGPLAMVHGR